MVIVENKINQSNKIKRYENIWINSRTPIEKMIGFF